MVTIKRGRIIGKSGHPWEQMWAYKQVESCHLTPVPQTISFVISPPFSFQEGNDLEQLPSSVLHTPLFVSLMCDVYINRQTDTQTHTHSPRFGIWDSCTCVFWEGFIKMYLWHTSQRWFSFPFLRRDSNSCGHLRENCSPPSPLPFLSLSWNVLILVLKQCPLKALLLNDHHMSYLPFIFSVMTYQFPLSI